MNALDWSTIITASYWPTAVVIIFYILRKQIRSLFFKNPTFGEVLIDLNHESKILDSKEESKLSKFDISDMWALNDISKYNGIKVQSINPVQKYAYSKLIETGFVRKDNGILLLTENGKKLVSLAEEIQI